MDFEAAVFQLQAGGYSRSIADRRYSFIGPDGARFAQERAEWIRRERGDDPRTGVALEVEGGSEWLVMAWAAWFLGLRVVPVDPRWSPARREFALGGCSVHVTADDLSDFMMFSSTGVSSVQPPEVAIRATDRNLAALEIQTSGSSGEPKRVVHSRFSMMAQGMLGAEALGLTSSDEWLAPVPVTHAAGIGAFLRAFSAGAGTTLIPEFDLDWVLNRLSHKDESYSASETVSVVSLVPTTLVRLLDAGLRKPPALKAAVIGGAPLSDELKSRALEAGVPVRASWGMTETLGMISVARTDLDKGCGRPLPGVEVVSDDQGQLLVRGPIVAPGLAGPDGWLHTGDAGYIDDEGFVHVEGRVGSMIISGGENVFPEVVEKALLETGLVTDAFVTGEPDPDWGQRVVAFVVPKSAETQSGEVREAVSSALAPWEIPKDIRFEESINRNELGKVGRGSDD